MHRFNRLILLSALVAALAAACGQKGPLRLPDPPKNPSAESRP